jgi:hypothetical protein
MLKRLGPTLKELCVMPECKNEENAPLLISTLYFCALFRAAHSSNT